MLLSIVKYLKLESIKPKTHAINEPMSQSEPINLTGILHRTAIDTDGESTVTLKIALSDINKVLELAKHTQKLLIISIEPIQENDYSLNTLG